MLICSIIQEPDTSVGKVNCYRLEDRDSIPVRSRPALRPNQPPIRWIRRNLGCAMVDAWNLTSAPPDVSMAYRLDRNNFINL
jgi:hypothetical protein